jgi:hypothetical protein
MSQGVLGNWRHKARRGAILSANIAPSIVSGCRLTELNERQFFAAIVAGGPQQDEKRAAAQSDHLIGWDVCFFVEESLAV